jgi:hypothetical protein
VNINSLPECSLLINGVEILILTLNGNHRCSPNAPVTVGQ